MWDPITLCLTTKIARCVLVVVDGLARWTGIYWAAVYLACLEALHCLYKEEVPCSRFLSHCPMDKYSSYVSTFLKFCVCTPSVAFESFAGGSAAINLCFIMSVMLYWLGVPLQGELARLHTKVTQLSQKHGSFGACRVLEDR